MPLRWEGMASDAMPVDEKKLYLICMVFANQSRRVINI